MHNVEWFYKWIKSWNDNKKELWELTQGEYVNLCTLSKKRSIRQQYKEGHKNLVRRAIKEGRPVPLHVRSEILN